MKRAGFSVIELIVTIAVSGAAMAICVLALARVYSVDSRARLANDLDRTLGRLATRLREDCRRCDSLKVSAGLNGQTLGAEFALAGGNTVSYQRQEFRLLRKEQRGTKTKLDSFTLPRGVRLSWSRRKLAHQELLELHVRQAAATHSSAVSFHAHRIVGIIGGQQRVDGFALVEEQP